MFMPKRVKEKKKEVGASDDWKEVVKNVHRRLEV